MEAGVLAVLQRVFGRPWRLEAAFDDDQDCSDLLRSEFPHMVDEELLDTVAILLNWKADSGRPLKRYRKELVSSALFVLPNQMFSICMMSFRD